MSNETIQTKLEILQEAHEFYADGMALVAWQKYDFAYNQFKQAKARFESVEAKFACLKAMTHCNKRRHGILDLRHLSCGIYLENVRITESQMNEMLKSGRYSTESSKSAGRRKRGGVSVKAAINQLLKDSDGPDNVKYEEALEEAKKADPNTGFNPMHWSYYKSMWKKQQREKAK